MRLACESICTTRFIRDAHGHGDGASGTTKRSERAVVVAATVSKPISIGIKPDARHKQHIRHDDLTGSRLMNPMSPNLHRHIRCPHMKFERLVAPRDDGQGGAPRAIARKPHGKRVAHIELAR